MKIRCPICHTGTTWAENPYRPFCSERCRFVDLGNWASEKYRIATEDKQGEASSPESVDAETRNGQEG